MVVFVEGNRRVAQDLRTLTRAHEFQERLSVVVGPIPRILNKVRGRYDLVVCDPPYDWKEPETLLPSAEGLVVAGGILVVEHHHKTPYLPSEGWTVHRVVKFGETRLTFFERSSVTGS